MEWKRWEGENAVRVSSSAGSPSSDLKARARLNQASLMNHELRVGFPCGQQRPNPWDASCFLPKNYKQNTGLEVRIQDLDQCW